MRTRLDEIVDQELKKWNGFVWSVVPWPTVVRDVAERAFRHGVEQGIDRCQGHGFDHMAQYVQPAPACAICKDGSCLTHPAEKKGPPVGACSCGTIGVCVTPGVIHRTDGPCFMDRRKGERRKEQWMQQLNTREGFKMKPWPAFDRRTRKDRRRG